MKIGKGIFFREENWMCWRAEVDGYVYCIEEVRNFDRNKGYKIEKRDGGNTYVYYLTKHKKGSEVVEGTHAHGLRRAIIDELRAGSGVYKNEGDDQYSVQCGEDTKVYTFCLHQIEREGAKPWEYDPEKTVCMIWHKSKPISDYFPTLRECLEYGENMLSDILPNKR